ncbi:DUF4402 domain-containing protein [Flavobacterium ovatum]|uniref:DUF4402 domain-containing protein n=1 Tax=Flavobacterium ovatum TaxID=1928857 RepID=UPI00344F9D70
MNFTSILYAQTRAITNTTASVSILRTYEIKKISDLTVNNISPKNNSSQTKRTNNASTSSYNSKSGTTAVNITEASFSVSDASNSTYSVDLNISELLVFNGVEIMNVDKLTCLTSKVNHEGADLIYFGATIHVNSDQASGIYSNLGSDLEVSVNYN